MRWMERSLLGFAAGLLAMLLLGCTENTDVMDDDDDAADDDAADDDAADDDAGDDDSGDDDSGDDDTAAAHTLEIHYDFAGYYDPATTCADAWIATLWITLSHDGQEQPQLSFPCDDTPIVISPVAEGSWTVMAASVEQIIPWTNPYTASDVEPVEVTGSPATFPVYLTLICHENGVDDGCGGA